MIEKRYVVLNFSIRFALPQELNVLIVFSVKKTQFSVKT